MTYVIETKRRHIDHTAGGEERGLGSRGLPPSSAGVLGHWALGVYQGVSPVYTEAGDSESEPRELRKGWRFLAGAEASPLSTGRRGLGAAST